MSTDFSKLFHQSSKVRRNGPYISLNSDDWPAEWKTIYYKNYERFPSIALKHDLKSIDFFELVSRRKTQRDFTQTPFSLDEISTLLKYSCGEARVVDVNENKKHRTHPSAGARFPIEIYLVIFIGNDDLKPGLYHYNIKSHALDVLWERKFSPEDIDGLFTYPWVKNASMAIVMTAVFWRNQNKYGERGYRYILLEAGHIGQNFYLASTALGLKCCALGGTKDEELEKLIDIDGVTESLVYSLVVGN